MTVTRRSSGVSLLLVVLVLTGAVSCEEARREVEGGEDQTSDLGGLRTSSAGLPARSGEADTSVKGSQGGTSAEYSRTGRPSDETHPEKDLAESRKKKDGMQKMYMLFMMWKSLISTKIMMLQPLFQIKSFFFSAIGLIIQILGLILQYKRYKSQMGGGGGGWSGVAGTGWEDRLGAPIPLAPNYITRYTIEQ